VNIDKNPYKKLNFYQITENSLYNKSNTSIMLKTHNILPVNKLTNRDLLIKLKGVFIDKTI